MAVTQNLSLALQSLRTPHEDRILWIDAICIDQNNDKERGHQVRQMGSIYAKAEQVLIWLGSATRETDLAFDFMSQFEKETLKHACRDWKVADKRWQGIMSSVCPLDDNGKMKLTLDQQHGLKNLLSRSWFDRVWIIQEVANARAARVTCGTKSVLARTFALSPYFSGIIPSKHRQAILDVMPGPTRKYSWWTDSHDLSTLLLKFQGSKASDSRDKIYALLSISSDCSSSGFPAPNYEISVAEVMQVTFTFLLQLHKGTNAISPPVSTPEELMLNLQELFNEAMIRAVEDGDIATAKHLLDSEKVNPNFRDAEGQTPLLRAAKRGDGCILKLLLDTGKVGVNPQDRWGRTPLALASQDGHITIVQLLIEKSRNINGPNYINTAQRDRLGWSPLCAAAVNGHEEIVQTLLYKGHTELSCDEEKMVLGLLEECKNSLIRRDKSCCQHVLPWAIQYGFETLFEQVLDTSAIDLDTLFIGHEPMVVWAARHGRFKIVADLLVKVGIESPQSGRKWIHPLVYCVSQTGDLSIRLMLTTGRAYRFFRLRLGPFATQHAQWKLASSLSKSVTALLDTYETGRGQQVDGGIGAPIELVRGIQAVVELLLRVPEMNVDAKDIRFERTQSPFATRPGYVNIEETRETDHLAVASSMGREDVVLEILGAYKRERIAQNEAVFFAFDKSITPFDLCLLLRRL
ncbi:hypothetical protein E8E13_006533 [Curvularia kusanoi]|uniref:Heterokaryon incompatibility domain-containing protein n=1 Tax=Curvularia kusanoi TaxID=90978 RepID=A0A9P4TGF9_CURKU|nr:hypothetical protein E8E13_006533 [Curvularia kusanoi]